MGAYMANKGTFKGRTLIKKKTWEIMHSDATFKFMDYNLATKFDKGGFCHFGMLPEEKI